MQYPVRIPRWVQRCFSAIAWRQPSQECPTLYLTFDDGPIPEVTPWVLDQLQQYKAQATFFCVGDNVRRYPELYAQVQALGHQVGNHTMHHCDGWQTAADVYLNDVAQAATCIKSPLFRPPYGRLTPRQYRALQRAGYQIVLWEVLTGDFDEQLSPEACWEQFKDHLNNGSIVVFHDSYKAWERLSVVLPRLLEKYHQLGYQFKALPLPPSVWAV